MRSEGQTMGPVGFPLTVAEPGRADAVLAAALDGLTRSAAQRWLEEGRVSPSKAAASTASARPGSVTVRGKLG